MVRLVQGLVWLSFEQHLKWDFRSPSRKLATFRYFHKLWYQRNWLAKQENKNQFTAWRRLRETYLGWIVECLKNSNIFGADLHVHLCIHAKNYFLVLAIMFTVDQNETSQIFLERRFCKLEIFILTTNKQNILPRDILCWLVSKWYPTPSCPIMLVKIKIWSKM